MIAAASIYAFALNIDPDLCAVDRIEAMTISIAKATPNHRQQAKNYNAKTCKTRSTGIIETIIILGFFV
jgi:hypothetical protein